MSHDSKNATCLDVRQLKMSNIAFQKSDVITFTLSLGHCTAKNKDIGSKFCALVVATQFRTMYSVFWISSKILFGRNFFVKNQFFFFFRSKTKHFEDPRKSFCRTFHLAYLALFACVFLQTLIF